MFRKLTLILSVSLSLHAQHHRTVCASGCTDTTLSAAITGAVAAQASTCNIATITLEAGQTSTGAWSFPAKTCRAELIVRSSRAGEIGNRRATVADAALMHQLMSSDLTETSNAVGIALGARGYAFEGIRFSRNPSASGTQYGLIAIGEATSAGPETYADGIRLSRFVIDNPAGLAQFIRGMNIKGGRNITIEDCSILGPVAVGADSQAIWAENAQLLNVRNCRLEGGGENFLAGGGGPGGGSLYPYSERQYGLRFYGNHFIKPLAWKVHRKAEAPPPVCYGDEWFVDTSTSTNYRCNGSTYSTTGLTVPGDYQVKNIFELKDGVSVYVIGNVLENSWEAWQQGQAFMNNNTGGLPYTVADWIIERNKVIRAQNTISNFQYPLASGVGNAPMVNAVVRNNWFEFMGARGFDRTTNGSRLIRVGMVQDYIFEKNTIRTDPDNRVWNIFDFPQGDPTSLAFQVPGGVVAIRNNIVEDSSTVESYRFPLYGSHCVMGHPSMHRGITQMDFSVGVAVWGTLTSGTCASATSSSPTLGTGAVFATGRTTVTNTDGTQKAGFESHGADIALVNASTSGAVSGAQNPFLDVDIKAIVPTGTTSAEVRYIAATPSACTVVVTGPGGSSVTETGVGRDRVATATGLTTKSRYSASVQCGSYPAISKDFVTL